MIDSSEIELCEITLCHKYLIRVFIIQGVARAESKEINGDRSWNGALQGFHANCIQWLMNIAGNVARYLFINERTLEVALCKGLMGGGCPFSKINVSDPSILKKVSQNSGFPSINKDPHYEITLAQRISDNLDYLTPRQKELDILEAVSPYQSQDQLAVAKILLEKCNQDVDWNNTTYVEKRALVLKITRKYLFAHFIKNPSDYIFGNNEKQEIVGNLENAIQKAEENIIYLPDMSMLFNLNAMKILIEKPTETKNWLNKIIGLSPFLIDPMHSLQLTDPINFMIDLTNNFASIYQREKDSYVHYLIIIDIFEISALMNVSGGSKEIQDFLNLQFKPQKELSVDEIHILLRFIQSCILKDKLSVGFLKEFLTFFTALQSSKDYKVRQNCASLLRVLRAHKYEEIKTIYEQKHREMVDAERDEKVKINLRLPPIDRHTKKIPELSNLRTISDYFIPRNEEIKEIEEVFNFKNRLTISGFGGTGKSILAVQYCEEVSSNFDIVWDIDFQSVDSKLSLLAEKFGLKKNQKIVASLMNKLKSNNIKKKILFLFDDVEDEKAMENYYVDDPNIKFLITSKTRSWSNIHNIKPISIDDSVRFLSHHIKGEEKDIIKLALRLNGWPLGLKVSVEIMKKQFQIRELLENFKEWLIGNSSINKTIKEKLIMNSDDAKFLLNLLACYRPKDIPEKILEEITVKCKGRNCWIRGREELLKYNIVNIDENSQLWSINELITYLVAKLFKVNEAENECLMYIEERLNTKELDSKKGKKYTTEIIELLPYAEALTQNARGNKDSVLEILYYVIDAYFWLNYNKSQTDQVIRTLKKISQSKEVDEETNAEVILNIARCYRRMGYYDKAGTYLLKSLNILQKILPENHPYLSILYLNIVDNYRSREDFDGAKYFYFKCLNIYEQIPLEMHQHLTKIYMNLSNYFQNKKSFKEAEAFYLNCKKILEPILPKNHPDLGMLYMNLGNNYHRKAAYDEADSFLHLSFTIFKQSLPKNHPDLAMLYMSLGNNYSSKAAYDEADTFLNMSLNIYSKILPSNHPDLAMLFMNLGNNYSNKADYKNAESFYLQSLNTYKMVMPENHLDFGLIYINLATLYQITGAFDQAEVFYFQCLNIYKQSLPNNHTHLAALYMNLGTNYQSKAVYDRAEHFYLESLNIFKQILPTNHPRMAMIYMNLANNYCSKEDYNTAEAYYMMCSNIRKKILPENHPDLALLYVNLATNYQLKACYDDAEVLYNQCLCIYKQILPENHPHLAMLYMSLGNNFSIKQDHNAAQFHYLECLKIRQQILPQNHPDLAMIYMNLGTHYQSKAAYDIAENYYQHALNIYLQILPENHPDLAKIYMNLGANYQFKAIYNLAEQFYLQCLNIFKQILPEHDSRTEAVCSELNKLGSWH